MSNKSIIATALLTATVAVALSACDDNKNHNNYAEFRGTDLSVNVLGAVAEGGDGGDGGNVANQGGQIAQDESIAADVEIDTITAGLTAIDSLKP